MDRRAWFQHSILAGLGGLSLPAFIETEEVPGFSIADLPLRQKANVIRLSHNENPFGPSPKTRQAIIDAIVQGNRYPRESIDALVRKIATKENLAPEQIMITAGSTEILGLTGLVYGVAGGELISGFPTFDFMLRYSQTVGATWVQVPLKDQKYDLAAIADKINAQTKLIFICNPNNPTGTYLPPAEVQQFINTYSAQTPVFVDEAYIELIPQGITASLAPMTRSNKNLIIGRTFSKIYGMAGLRLGYAIAHPETISKLKAWNIGGLITPSVCTLEGGIAAMDDTPFLEKTLRENEACKQMIYTAFDGAGIKYCPSFANFIWFATERFKTDIYEALRSQQIYTRNYSYAPGWCRVSMGTPKEIEQFIDRTLALIA